MGNPNAMSRSHNYFLYSTLAVGIALRCVLFPHLPPGLNQDEAAAAYEAYSLLWTGKDRWGNAFPIYFPGWGSGQNVLYSYLSIPAIALFGLNLFSTRLINLIFGIATLPLMYACVKQVCTPRIALYATALLSVLPWHVMLSRWGLESNLLPFFLLLGTYCIKLALQEKAPRLLIVFCLFPWAIGLYAYATSILFTPVFIALTFYYERRQIEERKTLWLCALSVFLGTAIPFILFLIKNNIFGVSFGFEQVLPFSIPLLPSQRIAQAGGSLGESLIFLFNGFNDELVWNSPPYFLPLFLISFPFLGIGLVLLIQALKQGEVNLFLLWLCATMPLIFLVRLNVNRANALFIPIIVISVIGFEAMRQAISEPFLKRVLFRVVAGWIGLNTILFAGSYFSAYGAQAGTKFQAGLAQSLETAQSIAKPTEPIFVTETIPLNYIYVLFWQKVNPKTFQQQADYRVEKGIYAVHRFDRYYFDLPTLRQDSPPSFVYLQRTNEKALCLEAPVLRTREWSVGRCLQGAFLPQ
jgi:4-amino-4-deoxy-L-arabinose transferase-like glycosyltransferase